jgi:hypothetical protein
MNKKVLIIIIIYTIFVGYIHDRFDLFRIGGDDYIEATQQGTISILSLRNPYREGCKTTGNPITPGPGYLIIMGFLGLFLEPRMMVLFSLVFLWFILKKRYSEKSAITVLLFVMVLTIRANIIQMDYLLNGGLLCFGLYSLD